MASEVIDIPHQVAVKPVSDPAMVLNAQKWLHDIQDTVIDSPFMVTAVTEDLGVISTKRKQLDDERKSLVEPLNGVVKAINDRFREPIAFCDQALSAGKEKLLAYSNEQRRIAREAEERRQREERARQEEAQRVAKAEADRLRAEAEELQRHAELAVRDGQDAEYVETLQSQAVAAAEQSIAVEQQAAQPVYVPPLPMSTKAVSGTSAVWKASVEDMSQFVQDVAARAARGDFSLLGLVSVDQTALNAMAKAQKEHLKIAGVRSYQEDRVAIRKR
jgi:hypothetical protein